MNTYFAGCLLFIILMSTAISSTENRVQAVAQKTFCCLSYPDSSQDILCNKKRKNGIRCGGLISIIGLIPKLFFNGPGDNAYENVLFKFIGFPSSTESCGTWGTASMVVTTCVCVLGSTTSCCALNPCITPRSWCDCNCNHKQCCSNNN